MDVERADDQNEVTGQQVQDQPRSDMRAVVKDGLCDTGKSDRPVFTLSLYILCHVALRNLSEIQFPNLGIEVMATIL